MKCSKYKKLLIEYADGRLQKDISQKLEVHLESCHQCRFELERLKNEHRLIVVATDNAIPEPDEQFIPKLRRRIEQLNSENKKIFSFKKNPYFSANPWLKIAFAMTILAFIMGAIILLRFPQNQRHGLTAAQMQLIKRMPQGETLIEMLPASQPYIEALLAAQQREGRHTEIISTLNDVNIQLLERVFQILEMSVEALDNPEIKEEEELSWDEEVI